MTQPKKGGKVSVEAGDMGQVDNVTVQVPDDHHWIYKYSKNGKLLFTRYVTLSADGKVHDDPHSSPGVSGSKEEQGSDNHAPGRDRVPRPSWRIAVEACETGVDTS